MKSRDEIQRAYDVLHFLVEQPEAPPILNAEASRAAHAMHDALAWVLGGAPCGDTFAAKLLNVEHTLRRLGFVRSAIPCARCGGTGLVSSELSSEEQNRGIFAKMVNCPRCGPEQ
jgi:hypothetical protein